MLISEWSAKNAPRLGYNAHIVRLADIQRVKKIVPRGVELRKQLIMRQTNNVYVVPFVRIAVTKGTGSLSIPKKLPVLSGAAATNWQVLDRR
jgi:hypothetical protein